MMKITAKVLLLIAFLFLITPEAKAQQLPNIVLIVIDDAGYDISPYNNNVTWTPNIQSIFDNGTLFTRFYTAISVCGPTRFSLMTAAHPFDYGADGTNGNYQISNFTGTTLAERLQEAGYRTGLSGKAHFTDNSDFRIPPEDDPLVHGFDYYHAWQRYPDYSIQKQDMTFTTTRFTEGALDFIRSTPSTQPFFLFLSYTAPHIYHDQFLAGITGQGMYADAMFEVDWAIGHVFDHINRRDQLDNTMFILINDNGYPQPGKINPDGTMYINPANPNINPVLDNGNPDRYDLGLKFENHFGWGIEEAQYGSNWRIIAPTSKKSMGEGGTRVVAGIQWPDGITHPAIDNDLWYTPDIFATIEMLVHGTNTTESGLDIRSSGGHDTIHLRWGVDRGVTHSTGWKWRSDTDRLYYIGDGGAFDETIDYTSQYTDIYNTLSATAHGDDVGPQSWGPPSVMKYDYWLIPLFVSR